MGTKLVERRKHIAANSITSSEVISLAKDYCNGKITGPILRARNKKIVTRIALNDTDTIILKLWSRPGLKASIRDITRTGSLFRELQALRHLNSAGINVPKIRGFSRLRLKSIRYTHALILEDISPSKTAMIYMGDLIREKRLQEAQIFEDKLIQLTVEIIRAHIIDPDHNMINILVTEDGTPHRIDFELARHMARKEYWNKGYGAMIGHIITSFIFSVQPDMVRAKAFSGKLIETLKPSQRVLLHAKKFVSVSLDMQKERKNIDTEFDLTW